jgi:glycine betaine/choline ABC-type transport system substrate-binding protein
MIARRSFAIVCLIVLLASCYNGRHDTIVIGSKNFSEQALLAEIVAQHLEARLAPAGHQALLSGWFLHLPAGAALRPN